MTNFRSTIALVAYKLLVYPEMPIFPITSDATENPDPLVGGKVKSRSIGCL